MFDWVRNHTKIMMGLLFLLIIPSFALFGIERFSGMSSKGAEVALVDGKPITQSEWDAAHKQEVDRLREARPDIDLKLLDSPQARYATLQTVVREHLLAAAAAKMHLTASDARLARSLEREPAIAALRGPDGKLDMKRYQEILARQGLSPEMFEARVRNDLSLRQVLMGVAGSAFAPAALTDVALDAVLQRREIQATRFLPAVYAAKVTPSDAQLQDFYQRNTRLFQAPEQASIEYVVLDLDALKKTVPVNEPELKSYYEQNKSRYEGQQERRASHILIAADKNASAQDKAQAKARAQELLTALRKAPDTFAEVARKQSQDPGSASRGGDLDFFAKGAMTPPFEQAVFSMKKGDISDLVETDFGYHIIYLQDIREPKGKTYESVRDDLEAELRKQQAQKLFAEYAEDFKNTVYEQSDSLKPVADKLGLPIHSAAQIERAPAPGATGPLANPKFLQALFTTDTIEKKHNTEAVELGGNQMVSGRITQYTPMRTRTFDEVSAEVRKLVIAQQSASLARQEGQQQLAAWQANPASASLPPAVVVSRDQPGALPLALVEAALKADANSVPAWTGVDLGDADGYAVIRINQVLPRETPPAIAQQAQQQMGQASGNAETLAYLELLKQRFKVKILVPEPATATATATEASAPAR